MAIREENLHLGEGIDFLPNPSDDVQGFAMYAEFSDGHNTLQLFITPDGYNEAGEVVRASVFRRRLSEFAPKKQWRSSWLGTQAGWDSDTRLRYESAQSMLRTLRDPAFGGTYSNTISPFWVEVSKEDLTLIDNYKTPTKLVYRIGQVRKALGYPELTFSK